MIVSEPPPGSLLGGRGLWSAYLDHARSVIVAGVSALDEDAQRRTLVPSGWTPLELLSHCLHMEQRWFVWGFLGEQVDDPWGDWEFVDGEAQRWQVPEGTTVEDFTERLESVAVRTRAVLRDHDLSERAALGGRFEQDPPTLEWICLHVINEYARHAGHLDIVVELGG